MGSPHEGALLFQVGIQITKLQPVSDHQSNKQSSIASFLKSSNKANNATASDDTTSHDTKSHPQTTHRVIVLDGEDEGRLTGSRQASLVPDTVVCMDPVVWMLRLV